MKITELKIKTDYIDINDVLSFLSYTERCSLRFELDSDYDVTYCNLDTSENPITIPGVDTTNLPNGVYKLCANFLYFGSFVVMNEKIFEIVSRNWINFN